MMYVGPPNSLLQSPKSVFLKQTIDNVHTCVPGMVKEQWFGEWGDGVGDKNAAACVDWGAYMCIYKASHHEG